MRIRKLFILLLLLPLSLFAQKAKVWNKPLYDAYPFHFGFAFTMGALDFSVSHSDYFMHQTSTDTLIFSIEGKARPLFGASMVSNLRINDNFDLRFIPGLHFGQRDLTYHMVSDKNNSDTVFHNMKIESTFLQFPLLLKYRAVRQNNYRPYLVGGLSYAIDLASRKKIKDEEQPKIRMNRQDLYLEMGFGVDYYLPFFKFSTELRFSYGLMNVVTYDDTRYTKVFDRLGSKMTTLVIYFE